MIDILTWKYHDIYSYSVELVLGPVVAGPEANARKEGRHGVSQESHYAEGSCYLEVRWKAKTS